MSQQIDTPWAEEADMKQQIVALREEIARLTAGWNDAALRRDTLKRKNEALRQERIEWATKTIAFLTLLEKAAGATIPNLREAREALDAAIKEQG